MSLETRVDQLERLLLKAQSDLNRLPLYIPPTKATRLLRIIGGNIYNGVDCIKYAASAAAITSLLDPDVTTSYSDGFGRAWLEDERGNQQRRVLVWHDYGGFTSPVPGAYPAVVRDTTVLTVASGPDAGKTMAFYRFTFPY